MSLHVWGIVAPPWYVADQVPLRLERALGPDWATKIVEVGSLLFLDADGRTYPMSPIYSNTKMLGGELYSQLRRAVGDGVKSVSIGIDVHVMNAR